MAFGDDGGFNTVPVADRFGTVYDVPEDVANDDAMLEDFIHRARGDKKLAPDIVSPTAFKKRLDEAPNPNQFDDSSRSPTNSHPTRERPIDSIFDYVRRFASTDEEQQPFLRKFLDHPLPSASDVGHAAIGTGRLARGMAEMVVKGPYRSAQDAATDYLDKRAIAASSKGGDSPGQAAYDAAEVVSPIPLGPVGTLFHGAAYGLGATDKPVSSSDVSEAWGELAPMVALSALHGDPAGRAKIEARAALAEKIRAARDAGNIDKSNADLRSQYENAYNNPPSIGRQGDEAFGEVSNIPPYVDPAVRAQVLRGLGADGQPKPAPYVPEGRTYVQGAAETGDTSKFYPDVEPRQRASDTLLASALRMDTPDSVLYPKDQPSGFGIYAEKDAAIKAEVAAKQAEADARYRRFMEPSGQSQIPAEPGSTRMGFDESTADVRDTESLRRNKGKTGAPVRGVGEDVPGLPEGPDAALYRTIPQSLWPRRAQSALEALVPERFKAGLTDISETPSGQPVEQPVRVTKKEAARARAEAKARAKSAGVESGLGPLAQGGVVPAESRGLGDISTEPDFLGESTPFPHDAPASIGTPQVEPARTPLARLNLPTSEAPLGNVEPVPPTTIEDATQHMHDRTAEAVADLERRKEIYRQTGVDPGPAHAHEELGSLDEMPGTANDMAPRQGPLGDIPNGPGEPPINIEASKPFNPYEADHQVLDDAASNSLDPEVHKAAEVLKAEIPKPEGIPENVPEDTVPRIPREKKGGIANAVDFAQENLIESDSHALRKMGPAGVELDRQMRIKDADAAGFAGGLSTDLARVAQGLSDEQIHHAVDVIEGNAKSNDPAVNKFVEVYKANDAKLIQLMKESGSQMKSASGKMVDFAEKENYWPRSYEEGFFDKNRSTIIESIMKKRGISYTAAENLLTRARKYSPVLADSLHERTADIPGYKRTLDVINKHYLDLADRAFTDKQLGINDLSNPESTANKLINQIGVEAGPDAKAQANDIARKFLGREDIKANPTVGAMTKYQALSKLVLSASSNLMGGIAMSFSRAKGTLVPEILHAFTQEGKFRAQELGTLESVMKQGAEDVGYGSKVSWGNTSVERFLRTVSGLAGEKTATRFFEDLKHDPTDAYAAKRLEELTLEDPHKLIMQDGLTEAQTKRAANRFTDLTQGRQNSLDLPHNWTNEPVANLLTQFKKYSFIQSKNMKNAILLDMQHGKINPTLKIALAAGVLGEVPADLKELIHKGTLSGRPSNLLLRYADNASNAYGIGLLGDAVHEASTGNPAALLRYAAGPTLGTAVDLASGLGGSLGNTALNARDAMLGEGKTNRPMISPFAKSLTRQVPVWGNQLAKEIPNF